MKNPTIHRSQALRARAGGLGVPGCSGPVVLVLLCLFSAKAESAVGGQQAGAPPAQNFYLREYRVLGSKHLKPLEVEKAVYPFLGPERTSEDIELARAALEQAYRDAGYQTVAVQVAAPPTKRGIVVLQVVEAPGRTASRPGGALLSTRATSRRRRSPCRRGRCPTSPM